MSENAPRSIEIEALDHLVLTVSDIPRTIAFFSRVLGMRSITFGDDRHALEFGGSKINLHPLNKEYLPRAARPTPGSADLCFATPMATDEVVRLLDAHGVEIEDGPCLRTGTWGPITSVYFRDPDENLIEIATYEG